MAMDKRGDKKYRFRIQFQGNQYTKVFYGTEREAKKAHDKFKYDIQSGEISSFENMRFKELAQHVYDEYVKTLRVTTQKIYANCYNKHILPVLGNMKIIDITGLHVQKLVNNLKKDLKPRTVIGIYSCLNNTFEMAMKWGYLKQNPCRYTDLPVPEKINMNELLSMSDIKKLFNLYDKEKNLMHKSAFYLAIGCGLRNSEIRALTLDDINFKDNTINVDKQLGVIRNKKGEIEEAPIPPKTTGSIRKVYGPPFVMQALKDYVNSLKFMSISKELFWNPVTQKPVSKHCLSKRFTSILAQNELPAIRFHDLRHIQATLLIHSGVNIQATAKRMGHSSINTTIETYIHSMDEIDKESAILLDNMVSKIKA